MALKLKSLEKARSDIPIHEVVKDEIVHINLMVPASTRRAWKSAGIKLDKSMSDMIREAMADYIARITK